MEVRTDSKKGPEVESLPEIIAAIGSQLDELKEAVRRKLFADFTRFGEVEVEVHKTFQEMADQFVAGVLGEAGKQPQLTEDAKKKLVTKQPSHCGRRNHGR